MDGATVKQEFYIYNSSKNIFLRMYKEKWMPHYLNLGKDSFQESLDSLIYVDKSPLVVRAVLVLTEGNLKQTI